MRTFLVSLFTGSLLLTLSVASGYAQVQTVDLSSLNFGIISQPQAVDIDGDPGTQEWLITRLFSADRWLVRIGSQGQVCVGPRFTVGTDWGLQKVGTVHVFTRLVWPQFQLLWLTPYLPPSC